MELDEERISQFLLKENCDLIDFKMNVPSASYMGGVWERGKFVLFKTSCQPYCISTVHSSMMKV